MSPRTGLIILLLVPFAVYIGGPYVGLNVAETLALFACGMLALITFDLTLFRLKMVNLMFALHMKVDAIGIMLAKEMGEESHQEVIDHFDSLIMHLKAQQDIADQADKLAKQQRRNRRRGTGGNNAD